MTFTINLPRPVKVGHEYWHGELRVIDASARGLKPMETCNFGGRVFCGAEAFANLQQYAA